MSVAGYVLTGGNSTRMGTDKALLRSGGVALAESIAGMVRQVAGNVTLIGDPQKYHSLGFPVVPDLRSGLGPLAGMETALLHSECEWNLIVACDLASISADFLEALRNEALTAPDDRDCLVPTCDGRLQPLSAIYRRRCLYAISSALNLNRRKVTDVVNSLKVCLWGTTDPQQFQNVNTPEDWNRYVNGRINELSPR